VCPYCGKQHQPHVDHHNGPDLRVFCWHANPGDEGQRYVRVERIEVAAVDFETRPIPYEGCPQFVGVDDEDDHRGSHRCGKGGPEGVCPDHGKFADRAEPNKFPAGSQRLS
jgi:hypothetical protein